MSDEIADVMDVIEALNKDKKSELRARSPLPRSKEEQAKCDQIFQDFQWEVWSHPEVIHARAAYEEPLPKKEPTMEDARAMAALHPDHDKDTIKKLEKRLAEQKKVLRVPADFIVPDSEYVDPNLLPQRHLDLYLWTLLVRWMQVLAFLLCPRVLQRRSKRRSRKKTEY